MISDMSTASPERFKEFQEQAKHFLEIEKTASRRYLSEDYEFCYNVERMGGKVWFCPWMKLSHVGTYVFGGSLLDLAMIGAAATADASQLKKKGRDESPALKDAEAKRKRKARKTIEHLEKMTKENGATENEADVAKQKIEDLKKSIVG